MTLYNFGPYVFIIRCAVYSLIFRSNFALLVIQAVQASSKGVAFRVRGLQGLVSSQGMKTDFLGPPRDGIPVRASLQKALG